MDARPQPINPDSDIRGLVFAVVLDAKRCAAAGDRKASKWLRTEGALWMDAVTNIHPDRFRKAIRRRKPKRKQRPPDWWKKYQKPAAVTSQTVTF